LKRGGHQPKKADMGFIGTHTNGGERYNWGHEATRIDLRFFQEENGGPPGYWRGSLQTTGGDVVHGGGKRRGCYPKRRKRGETGKVEEEGGPDLGRGGDP